LLFIMRSVLTVKACQGKRYRLPVAGDLAVRYSPERDRFNCQG
jgi:uncharacterized membrane protein